MPKRILITGASGFVGLALSRRLLEDGFEVVALSRRPKDAAPLPHPRFHAFPWDARTDAGWAYHADGAFAVINLAGDNLAAGRWSCQKKQAILQSRLDAVHAVSQAIQKLQNKPNFIIQASAIGIYGDRGEEKLTEKSAAGTGFLADVCKQWEHAAQRTRDLGVRLAVLRLGMVLGTGGGALAKMVPVFRKFLGGVLGNGRQWISWVHIDDVIGIVRFLLENQNLDGAFNVTSPQPVQAQEFYGTLGKVLHRPSVFKVPGFVLKLLQGEMAKELLLSSQRIQPQRLLEAGYPFHFADLQTALEDILGDE
jgi:uncharacterized protein (TIGR01777 family)